MADDARTQAQTAPATIPDEADFLDGSSAVYVEKLHDQWRRDPRSVPETWRAYFERIADDPEAVAHAASGPSWDPHVRRRGDNAELTAALDGDWTALEGALAGKISKAKGVAVEEADVREATKKSLRALMLIRAYRVLGHRAANLDPLGLSKRETYRELDPETYGFGPAEMDEKIFLDGVLGMETGSIREVVDILQRTYCGTFGVEFTHIADPEQKAWLQERLEGPEKEISFTPEGKKAILQKLVEAEVFENFVHRRYPGTKRFGIDGGEAMVPALEQIIKRGGALGVDEIVIGMPHRGRLNVLAAVMGKPYRAIFHEFQGGSTFAAVEDATGDVKYHLGASSDREFDGNRVHLSLTANPSHLEAVNPVVLGKARAKQFADQREEPGAARTRVMPLLLHGDASFAGQGVVAECLSFSGLRGHRTGGCVHFIVNNQIGFTTSPRYARSSPYPSDVALMIQAPVFHVNGDDPEAVVHAAKVATEFRQRFAQDVVVDMFCYRRFGHNEGDDPSFTQPLMYERIRNHPTTRTLYAQRLIAEGVVSEADIEAMASAFEAFLNDEFDAGESYKSNKADWLDGEWSGLGVPQGEETYRGRTAVSRERLLRLGRAMTETPEKYAIHKTLKRIIDGRREAIETGEGIDWATAEHLAFATLLDEGFPVRLAGQDSGRGTFSQRHSHLVDQNTEKRYTFLQHLREGQAPFEVIDSSLSEYAALGFEYGYSLAAPNTLVLWEAQFGDFANGAQIMFDQFISSGERKWLRMSGLVCLLPHGYEGQGPEHSSARLERYLQMCAQENMQVANCSTPASYFHILRRQICRNFRKPLVLMTPKSLLRHKLCVSDLADMAEGSSFHRVLWDDADTRAQPVSADHAHLPSRRLSYELAPDERIRRVVMCSGKVYYDLVAEREKRGIDDVYLLRVEQFYPFPAKSLMQELDRFKGAEMIWCQEEPKNMGAWTFMDPNLNWVLERVGAKHQRAVYAGRPASASTAAGVMSQHKAEQEALLEEALGS